MVVNIFGKRGAGKTTTIRGQIPDCRPPIVIIDILGNFSDVEGFHSKKLSEILNGLVKFHEKNKIWSSALKTKEKIYVLQTADFNAAIDYISAALWELGGGTLILDEIDAVNPSESPCFVQLIRYGRNRNIDLLTGCRRPAEIDRNLTAAANKFYCFQTHEFRDIDYFKENGFGKRAFEIQSRPPFSGMFLDHDSQEMGYFHIDKLGNIFHDRTWTLKTGLEMSSPESENLDIDDEESPIETTEAPASEMENENGR